MRDPVLGQLTPDPQLAGSFETLVTFEGREIPLHVNPDDSDLETSLQLARALVEALETHTSKAKAAAAKNLLAEYNQHWRDFQRYHQDGAVEDVMNPALCEDAFMRKLRLASLSVEGTIIDFHFEDGGLFAGHSVFVTSFDGLRLEDTAAALFG